MAQGKRPSKKSSKLKGNMRLSFVLCFIVSLNVLYAQQDTLVFYPVNNYSLQQCDVRSMIIDNNNKLWLGTNRGIACYDGNNIQIFDNDNGFFGLFKNPKSELFTIQSQGIYLFNTKTGTDQYLNIALKPGQSFGDPRNYTDIYIDTDESIWCGRVDGFFHFNLLTKEATYYPLYSTSNKEPLAVRNIQSDAKNYDVLWLATDDGIYMFDKKLQRLQRNFNCSNRQDSVQSDLLISKIYLDSKDNIWFAGKRGVGFYNVKKGFYTIYPCKENRFQNKADINLKFLQPKSLDEFYIGSTENCPGVFDIKTHKYIFNSKTYKQFSALRINHFVADDKGNLWCLIFGQLYYASANKNKFSTIPLGDFDNGNRSGNIFKTVIWDSTRKCFYAAFDNSNSIFVLDTSMNIVRSIPIEIHKKTVNQFSETNTYDISLDSKGRLWGCGTSVIVYDSVTRRMVPANKLYIKLAFKNQRFQNTIYRNGYLYLQPSNPSYKAIYRINLTSFDYDSIPIPYDIIPAGYENSWNERKYQEVAVIDKPGKYAYVGIGNSILQIDLATKKGKKITRVTLRDNGYYFNMFWYVLDDAGNLWITSSDGIKIIDPNNLKLIKKIGQDEVTQRFQLYNAEGLGIMCLLYSNGVILYDYRNSKEYNLSLSDGLITLFNSGIACVNNILFVGAELNAMQYLKLSSITGKNVERRCYLSEIHLFNQPYYTDTLPEYMHSLQLPHDKNFVELTFSSTEFEQSEQLIYRYRLAGVDNDWVYTDYLNRTISYNDLKPGEYVFYTSIQNTDGRWNDSKINLAYQYPPHMVANNVV